MIFVTFVDAVAAMPEYYEISTSKPKMMTMTRGLANYIKHTDVEKNIEQSNIYILLAML